MYDQETNSQWSHLLGKAMEGPLKGAVLPVISSSMTEWGAWQQRYPETTVLWMPRSANQFRRGYYRLYRNFVLGVKHRGRVAAWQYSDLMQTPVQNDDLFGDPVVVLMDKETVTPRVYDRRLDDATLEFRAADDQIVDTQTGSIWDFMTGRCTDGTYEGRVLKPLAVIPSFRRAWMTFYPNTIILGADEK